MKGGSKESRLSCVEMTGQGGTAVRGRCGATGDIWGKRMAGRKAGAARLPDGEEWSGKIGTRDAEKKSSFFFYSLFLGLLV